ALVDDLRERDVLERVLGLGVDQVLDLAHHVGRDARELLAGSGAPHRTLRGRGWAQPHPAAAPATAAAPHQAIPPGMSRSTDWPPAPSPSIPWWVSCSMRWRRCSSSTSSSTWSCSRSYSSSA